MADKLTLVTKKELLNRVSFPVRLFAEQADQTEVVIPENLVFALLQRLCFGERVQLECFAAENGLKVADSILFQDEFPVLLHNSQLIAKSNIFRYLKKATTGLVKAEKGSDLAS